MPREHGRLYRRQGPAISVEFTRHSPTTGPEPAYFELHDLADPLADDELIVLESACGRRYHCRALDSTDVCATVSTRVAAR
jgi:hypothetical protein